MNTLQLLSIGTFLMGYHYFVLRTYNTLGLRLFSLCFFVSIGVFYWWYTAYVDLRAIRINGLTRQAIVLNKSTIRIAFGFPDSLGKPVIRMQTGNIAADELAAVIEGQRTSVLYNPRTDRVYLITSYQRLLRQTMYKLSLVVLLLLTGMVCLITFRRYRVLPHEGTIYEYLVDEHGKIVFDHTLNGAIRSVRENSTMNRLPQRIRKP